MNCINCKKEIKDEEECLEMDTSKCFNQVIYGFGADKIFVCKNCSKDEALLNKIQFDFLTGNTFQYDLEEEN